MTDLPDRRDRELLDLIATGDEDAFADLYRRYGSVANGLAVRVIGDRALAEEVLQEVFLSIWRRPEAFDEARGSVRSWLLAQIHHRAVDVVRKEQSERRRTLAQAPEQKDEVDDVIEAGWLESRRAQVRTALAALAPEHREILDYAYFAGMTQTQIAETTGMPLGTVKSRTLAAMTKLRSALGRAAP